MSLSCMRRALAVLAVAAAGLASGAGALPAQESFTIQGTVVDATSLQPLPNAAVLLRGTGLGTLTNQNGQYTLIARVPPGDYTLEYQLIGRGSAIREVTLAAATRAVQLDPVPLEQSAVQLDEIVVTGTGAPTERRAIGNAVATVSGAEVAQAPAVSSVDQALQGRVVGAVISENSGQPGGGVSIRLRGTSSILGGAEPLIVVDGVIVDNNAEALQSVGANTTRQGAGVNNRLSDIPPESIERIEVIKGAAAAALYGSRANNGVIQIFTRRGTQGAPRITFSTSVEASRTPDRYDLLLTPVAARADSLNFFATRGVRPGDPIERFDVQDQIFRTGYGTNNQVSVSGGGEATTYYVAGGYRSEEGIIRSSGYERANVQAKLTQQLADWLEVTVSGSFIDSETNFVTEGEQTTGVLTTIIFGPTSYDFSFDEATGRFPFNPAASRANPLDVIENWEIPESVTRFLGSAEATLRPSDALTLRYLFGIDDYRQQSRFFRPPLSLSATDVGLVSNPLLQSRQFNHDLTLNHEAELTETWGLTTTAGLRYTSDDANTVRAGVEGIAPGTTLVTGATQFASQSQNALRTLGGFLQERLSFGDRLFLTGGLNVEAASAFPEEQRWQLYPRLGASWIVNEEPFFETSAMAGLLSTLRVRAAYGETGGQPPASFIEATYYPGVAYSGRPGVVPSTTVGNPDLEPERQREWELGFEAGLFQDRAVVDFTYYDQKTTDLVLQVPLAPSTGAQLQYQNIGEIVNRGVELGVNTVNVDRPGFGWLSRVTFSANRNRVEQLARADTLMIPGEGYPNAVIVGEPIGVFYGRGYVRDDDGAVVIDPLTGVGARTATFHVLGDPNPDWSASLSNTFTFGQNFEVSALVDGRFGNDVMNFTRRITDYFGTGAEVEEEIRAAEAGERRFISFNVARISNYEEYTEDGSFVKLREVALRYRLGAGLLAGLGVESATLQLAGRNLYTWTDYSGLDPEVNLFSANTVARGVDFATVPVPRSFLVGLDFSF